MIRLEGVGKRYGIAIAVEAITLEVSEGDLVTLIGPSGCGKTTTLKMINRLIEPSSGRIIIGGKDVTTLNPQQLRRGIGYVIQSIGLFPHMTVRQNIQVVPDLLGWPKKKSAARADELLELTGLEAKRYADAYPRELSGGQAQRVGVARALAVDPPILLMDEPFGAVDPLTRDHLQDEFLGLQRRLRKTIVMVTHDIDEAIKMADRVCVMNLGHIEQYDPPEVLLAEPKNKFVRQFVGSDRALKRLSRLPVKDVMETVVALDVGASPAEAEAGLKRRQTVYITERERLVGWLDRKAFAHERVVREAYTQVEVGLLAIRESDDTKEALARMLSLGVTEMPVIDRQGTLVGLIELRAIATLTTSDSRLPVPA